MKKTVSILLIMILAGAVFWVSSEAQPPPPGMLLEEGKKRGNTEELEGLVMENHLGYLIVNERVIYVRKRTRIEDSQENPVGIEEMEPMKKVWIQGTPRLREKGNMNADVIRLME